MAAVDFKRGKCHGGTEVSALLRHCDPCRASRARVFIAKKKAGEPCHINPEMSPMNYFVNVIDKKVQVAGNTSGYYENVFKNYKKIVKQFDDDPHQTNHRKDRTDVIFLEIPFPKELSGTDTETYEKGQRWIVRAVECIRDVYRGTIEMVMLPGTVHVDEIHDYYDVERDMMRTSVVHAHVPCLTIHTDTGSFNGKWFSSRAHMNKVNSSIQKMTQEEFGCDFLTGEKYKSRKTVEELKSESERAANEMKIAKIKLREEQRNTEKKAEEMRKVLTEVDQITEQILRQLAEAQNRVADDDLEKEFGEFCDLLTTKTGKFKDGQTHRDLYKRFHEMRASRRKEKVSDSREELLQKVSQLQGRIERAKGEMGVVR